MAKHHYKFNSAPLSYSQENGSIFQKFKNISQVLALVSVFERLLYFASSIINKTSPDRLLRAKNIRGTISNDRQSDWSARKKYGLISGNKE